MTTFAKAVHYAGTAVLAHGRFLGHVISEAAGGPPSQGRARASATDLGSSQHPSQGQCVIMVTVLATVVV